MKTNYKKNKKTIVIIFRYKYPIVGLRDILQRIEILENKYNIIIITNTKKALDNLKCKIITIKGLASRGTLFLLRARWALFFEKYDAVFLTSIGYSPISIMIKTRPVICYGNVNPKQICGIKDYENLKKEGNYKFLKKSIKLKYLYACLKKCDKVLAISKQLAEEYIINGIRKDNLEIIYMGVDNNIFDKKKKNNRRFTIVYPGSISEERGLSTILDGLRILSGRMDNFIFKFIGCNDRERKEVLRRAERLGISKHIECLPIVDIKRSAEFIRNADVGISILENNEYFRTSPPTKVYEYMACGIPTVANKIATHTDYIKDGYNGLIINDTPNDFADAILRLYNNPKLRIKLSNNAYNSSKDYTWEKQRKAFLKVFDKVLSKRS